jgi:glutathione S-transferase
MQGQANHFIRSAPEPVPYAIKRYIDETKRLYGVAEMQLAKSSSGFLVGDRLTIADISIYGWVRLAGRAVVDIEEFPNLMKWEKKMDERDGVKKGRDVPTLNTKETLKDGAAALEKKMQEGRA